MTWNQAIKLCKVCHSEDDINILHLSKSISKLTKYANLDMENLTDWLKCKSDLSKCTEN